MLDNPRSLFSGSKDGDDSKRRRCGVLTVVLLRLGHGLGAMQRTPLVLDLPSWVNLPGSDASFLGLFAMGSSWGGAGQLPPSVPGLPPGAAGPRSLGEALGLLSSPWR